MFRLATCRAFIYLYCWRTNFALVRLHDFSMLYFRVMALRLLKRTKFVKYLNFVFSLRCPTIARGSSWRPLLRWIRPATASSPSTTSRYAQCDQRLEYLSNFLPFKAIKICPMGNKICQSRFKILTKT